MKTIRCVTAAFAMLLATQVWAQDFNGAKAVPYGKVDRADLNQQFQIQFPVEIKKADAFTVTCIPETKGTASWANNNMIWTYNLETEYPGMPGGASCTVQQTADLTGIDGTVWKAGTITYNIQAKGPNVTNVSSLTTGGGLRESETVILIQFDGEIVPESFFANQNTYLSYTSSNAPAEKIPLMALPDDKLAEIRAYVIETQGLEDKKSNWILATVGQNLIPGAKLTINISGILSKYTTQASDEKFTDDLEVRDNFNAKVECARPSITSPLCMPNAPIYINFSAKTKWAGAKISYIEYVPFNTKDGKKVRAYAELTNEEGISYWQRAINFIAGYVPYASKFSETLVEQVVFKVSIEPQTTATVTLPSGLVDIDNRPLMNTNMTTNLIIGSPREMIRVPQEISFFEKNVNKVAMPIGVVNLNQDLNIRKSGAQARNWQPVRDYGMIIKAIRAYAARGDYREMPDYTSPMEMLGLVNNAMTTKLTGKKNHSTFLQLDFGKDSNGASGGLYAMEINSPSLDAASNDPKNKSYLNPQYVLAQLTNLSVNIKQGEKKSLIWVTTLDAGVPVAGADVEIRNCLGAKVKTVKTDASGLAAFDNQPTWATDCGEMGSDYTYGQDSAYFVFAKKGQDFTFGHSSWSAKNSYAMGAPGIEYFYSQLSEGRPFFHAVVGVNLVKPGQKVPVQLIAKVPTSFGFAEVPKNQLPTVARVTYSYDSEVYFDFPITWNNGAAEFIWQVPADTSVKLGQYEISLIGSDKKSRTYVANSEVEVAEFKVPIMSGSLAFPGQPLVRPDSVPVNANIRYANGVGAKNLDVAVTYYFQPSSLYFEGFGNFEFGNGKLEKVDRAEEKTNLPTDERPGMLEGLKTDDSGSLTVDIAAQKLSDGKSIAEVLKTVKRTQKVIARARYMDQMGEFQTLSAVKEIFTADKFVGTKVVSGYQDKARLEVAVVGADGKSALKDASDVSLKVYKVTTKVIAEELFGGLIRNTYEREITAANWKQACSATDVAGVLSCGMGGITTGSYAFEATLADGSSSYVMFKVDDKGRVYGSGYYYDFGDDENSKQLPLAMDKATYKDGDKAVISFAAPFKTCQALVTLERESVLSSMVVANACEKGNVTIPVSAALAPNVFVSVYAVTGRADGSTAVNLGDIDLGRPTYKIGFANLKVDIAQYKLGVAVATDKATYKPGETVQVSVKVSPELGRLTNAKMTFVAIEEKILELKANQTYDVLQAFMQLRNHGVQTFTSLDRIETVTAKNADGLEKAGADSRKGGDEGGDGGSKGELKRKLFDAIVKMQTNIPVVNGVATASFVANDSLTKFKIFAIVTDASQKFGSGTATYLSAQDTQTFANIPPVAYTGDGYPLKVSVQNNTSAEQTYKVQITATSKDAAGNVVEAKVYEKQQKIGASSSVAVDVGDYTIADGVETVEYVIRVYDGNGNLVDTLEPDAQKIYAAVPVTIRDSLVVQMDQMTLSRSFSKEANALAGKGDLTAALSSSLVDSVQAQILSRLATADTENLFLEVKLNVALLTSAAAKPEALKKVLELMVNYTDSSGFVKYVPQNQTGSLWLTVAMLKTLSTEAYAPALVPESIKGKFAKAVQSVLDGTVDSRYIGTDPSTLMMARILYAQVAEQFGDSTSVALAKTVAEEVNAIAPAELVKWNNAALAEALALLAQYKGADALKSAVYVELTSKTRIRYSGNTAELIGAPAWDGFGYSDEVIDSAILLRSLAQLDGSKDVARALALGLTNAAQSKWYITRTMVWVSAAMKSFATRFEKDAVTGTTTVDFAMAKVSQAQVWASRPKGLKVVAPWATQDETLTITHAGKGMPWVSINARQAVKITAPVTQGLSIEKTAVNITRTTGEFMPGDLIEVTLKINAAAVTYHVSVRDPIPAGSNIIGEAYGDISFGEKSYRGYQFYMEAMPQGQSIIKYQYQINNVGTFNLPPTRAEGIYMPSIFAETPNAPVIIK